MTPIKENFTVRRKMTLGLIDFNLRRQALVKTVRSIMSKVVESLFRGPKRNECMDEKPTQTIGTTTA